MQNNNTKNPYSSPAGNWMECVWMRSERRQCCSCWFWSHMYSLIPYSAEKRRTPVVSPISSKLFVDTIWKATPLMIHFLHQTDCNWSSACCYNKEWTFCCSYHSLRANQLLPLLICQRFVFPMKCLAWCSCLDICRIWMRGQQKLLSKKPYKWLCKKGSPVLLHPMLWKTQKINMNFRNLWYSRKY